MVSRELTQPQNKLRSSKPLSGRCCVQSATSNLRGDLLFEEWKDMIYLYLYYSIYIIWYRNIIVPKIKKWHLPLFWSDLTFLSLRLGVCCTARYGKGERPNPLAFADTKTYLGAIFRSMGSEPKISQSLNFGSLFWCSKSILWWSSEKSALAGPETTNSLRPGACDCWINRKMLVPWHHRVRPSKLGVGYGLILNMTNHWIWANNLTYTWCVFRGTTNNCPILGTFVPPAEFASVFFLVAGEGIRGLRAGLTG